MTRLRLRRRHDDRGASAVEFALILPLVMAVLGMVITTGWLVVQRALLDRATEVVARELTLGATLTQAAAEASARTPVLTLGPGSFTATRTPVLGGTATAVAGGEAIPRGHTFTVTASVSAPLLAAPLMAVLSATPDTIGLTGLAQGARL